MLKKYTISQLVSYIKTKLTDDMCLQNISVEGEIGNFINHTSGHWYFSLKENDSLINCVMFKYSRQSNFIPINGDKVLLYGNVNIYERSGQIQIQGYRIEKVGNGDFYIQFEKIKNKLEPLGYFDQTKKKIIPKYCNKIVVITGANTAALQDVRRTISLRWPMSQLTHISAIMQGETAPQSCIEALKLADTLENDVILLVRGGGSIDDLFCFNDEFLAKQIYETKTPIITGIGHEIDYTIADLVADYRAATPTAAAEKCTPNQNEVYQYLQAIRDNLNKNIINKLNYCQQDFDLQNHKLHNYEISIINIKNSLDNYKNKLISFLQNNINITEANLMISKNSLNNSIERLIDENNHKFINLISKLEVLSPLNTLSRGYSVSLQDNKVVKCIQDIDFSKELETRFIDGSITCKNIKRN